MDPYHRSELKGPAAWRAKAFKIAGSIFNIDERFVIHQCLGTGAFGVVISARDSETNELVAIKKIEKAFEHLVYTKRTLRELKIMRLLDHENIIKIKSIQLPESRDDFKEIYVVLELMDSDLSSVIKSEQDLSDEHCQFFLYQILRGLKFMHSAGILHRDLKPRNLLVSETCDLKICDFGLARAIIQNLKINTGMMTDYIANRWYRAPEVLLMYKYYTSAIDIWSVGCIFAELLLRRPVFPGNDVNTQLQEIFNLIGTPTAEEIQKIPNARSREIIMKMPKRKENNFANVFRNCNPLALDLLKELLAFDPEKRISADQALRHPYLRSFHLPDDEPETTPVTLFDFDFEVQNLNKQELKDLLYEEILLYHFTDKKQKYECARQDYLTSDKQEKGIRREYSINSNLSS